MWCRSRRWRRLGDLDISARHIERLVPVYRIACTTCGRRELPVTLARPHGRCTKRLERDLFRLTKDMTGKAVSGRTDLDWETVKDAEVRYIRGRRRKRKPEGITRIGIDEVSHPKGHKYLTLVTDMHDPYVKVLRRQLPKAARVYDHFHGSKAIPTAIDEIRRRRQRDMPKKDRDLIKGKRWVLLRARENLTDRQEVSLKEWMAVNAELAAAYILKEEFRWVFRAKTRTAGEKRLLRGEEKARESAIPELLDVLKTIERRREGIMNFFGCQVTNGMAEGFNNVVGTIQKQAYGFPDLDDLKLKILRVCGKLDSGTLMHKTRSNSR